MSKEHTAESDAPTDSGHKVGDPCQAIVAQFVSSPQTCMKTSVTVGIDPTWGTTHVACAEHGPRVTLPEHGERLKAPQGLCPACREAGEGACWARVLPPGEGR